MLAVGLVAIVNVLLFEPFVNPPIVKLSPTTISVNSNPLGSLNEWSEAVAVMVVLAWGLPTVGVPGLSLDTTIESAPETVIVSPTLVQELKLGFFLSCVIMSPAGSGVNVYFAAVWKLYLVVRFQVMPSTSTERLAVRTSSELHHLFR